MRTAFWLRLIGMLFAKQAVYKGIEGRDWGEMYEHYKETSRAAGVGKPNESQKSEGPLANEGGQRQERGFL